MTTTPTANKAFAKPDVDSEDSTWGGVLNTVIDALDSILGGKTTISASGTTVLSDAQQLSSHVRVTAAGNATLTFAKKGVWFVSNDTSGADFTVTVKTAGQTSPPSIPSGSRGMVACDGSNCYLARTIDIEALTESTAPALADLIALHDAGDDAQRRMTLTNFFKAINLFPQLAAADIDPLADFVLMYDGSTDLVKKARAGSVGSGKQKLWVPAATFYNAAAPLTNFFSTRGFTIIGTRHADGTNTISSGYVAMPANYDGGTITAAIYWSDNSTSNGSVRWILETSFMADGGAPTAGFELSVAVDFRGGGPKEIHITPEMTFTTGGAGDNLLLLKVTRNGGHADDTMAGDAMLLGVAVTYTTDSNVQG